jgi:hypothetical protein
MASKHGRTRKSPDKQKTRAEIAKHLKDGQEGAVTRLEMETGLEEVDESRKRMLVFIRHIL